MRIAFVGKFRKMHDEEYIARSFEMLGHTVDRIEQITHPRDVMQYIREHTPDILLYTKWDIPVEMLDACKVLHVKTVCWLFDLYFDYSREWQVNNKTFFRSQYVFTTDGGHDKRWKEHNINHRCVRQGIYKEECEMLEPTPRIEVVFVGSKSPIYPERNETMKRLANDFKFKWFGERNTDEIRGLHLNRLFSASHIVVGDSFYSPHYWSNRVVETLGRGGFLIHRDVPGIKEEYPDLVTYDGTYEDLKSKIEYYLKNESERVEIIKKNFEHVKNNYTMDKKCQELLNYIS